MKSFATAFLGLVREVIDLGIEPSGGRIGLARFPERTTWNTGLIWYLPRHVRADFVCSFRCEEGGKKGRKERALSIPRYLPT